MLKRVPTRQEFEQMAARGRLHKEDNTVIPTDSELDEAQSPVDLGRLYGSGIGNRGVTAQLIVGDSRNTITLARSTADVSPPYGFMLLPGTTSSGFAMKRSSFSLSHTKSAPFMALE